MAVQSPLARVVPSSFRKATWHIKGVTPYMMGSDRGQDPFDTQAQALRQLTAEPSSKWSIDKAMTVARVEWELRMYWDPDIGPYVPGSNPKEALAESGRHGKRETIRKQLMVLELKLPLQYDGPRDLETLWDEGYRDMRGVVNASRQGQGSRVRRCRPLFEAWELTVPVAYNPAELDTNTLVAAAELAQIRGLGDGRRIEFGQFTSVWEEEEA
jgi:hypothetical protein